jgi:hypothetical protein
MDGVSQLSLQAQAKVGPATSRKWQLGGSGHCLDLGSLALQVPWRRVSPESRV